MEKQIDFIDSEHMAGFHDKVQEGCYECVKENRLLLAKKTVDFDSTIKFFGDINKVIYGINPYEK